MSTPARSNLGEVPTPPIAQPAAIPVLPGAESLSEQETLSDARRCLKAKSVFSHLQPNESQVLRRRRQVWGHWVYVAALRLADGELLVVVMHHRPHQAIGDYTNRWAIEIGQPQCPHNPVVPE